MDIIEAICQRKSIRAFKPDAVTQKILREIIELASRAPSWANTQPWEFAIVGGSKLEEIKRAVIAKMDELPNPDLATPREYPELLDIRRRAAGRKISEITGISREDIEKRTWWRVKELLLFEARCAIYIYIDRSYFYQNDSINVWPIFDCGLIAENIMLLAASYGLGTLPAIQTVVYPDVLRDILGIPDSKLIVLGIAVGYPEWDDPVNQFQSEREPLDRITRWYGFD